jgi:putative transposase
MVPNLDALAQKRRDKAAARGCGKALLAESAAFKPGAAQNRYRATAQLSRVKPDIPERAHVKHVFVKTATRVNNRAGNSRQPTRRRERQMCSFRDARRTQALPRHQMSAVCHRAVLKERFATWHGWTITGAVEKTI